MVPAKFQSNAILTDEVFKAAQWLGRVKLALQTLLKNQSKAKNKTMSLQPR